MHNNWLAFSLTPHLALQEFSQDNRNSTTNSHHNSPLNPTYGVNPHHNLASNHHQLAYNPPPDYDLSTENTSFTSQMIADTSMSMMDALTRSNSGGKII